MNHLRLSLLICFYISVAAVAVHTSLVPKQGSFDLLLSLFTALVVTLLCITDSKVRGKPMVQAAQWIMFFTWPIAVPIYLVWSRGAKGLLILFGHIVALLVMVTAIIIVIEILVGVAPA